jgi:TPR repeat protein
MLVVLVALASTARATPQEDHQRGLLAYQRGDVAGAMTALRAPAKAGYAASQSLLGYLLDRADFTTQAADLWQAAAAQGDAEAHAGLANLYLAGRGFAKDEKQALQHFSEAAARGHPASVEVVAIAWLRGQLGADAAKQPALAQAAITRAAGQGHLASADALAAAYRSGQYGLAIDDAQAAQWQTRAATWRLQRAAVATASGAKAGR